MGKKSFLFGAIIGGAAAFAATLLVTPESGEELRNKFSEKKEALKNRVLDYTDYASQTGGDWGDSAKEKFAHLADQTQGVVSSLKDKIPGQAGDEFTSNTAQFKDDLMEASTNLKDELANQSEDIVIDAQSAFGEAKEAAQNQVEAKIDEATKAKEDVLEAVDTDEEHK